MKLNQIKSHQILSIKQKINRFIFHRIAANIITPKYKYITDGDLFFTQIWNIIDTSQTYFFILTYAIDNSPPTNLTLEKLILAQKRGVISCILVDALNAYPNHKLIQEYEQAGGKYVVLNRFIKIFWNLLYFKVYFKQMFRRHHQKLIISDDKSIIGSSNIQEDYGGIKYGTLKFHDFNFYSEKIELEHMRNHIFQICKKYSINISQNISNSQLQKRLDKKYPSSPFTKNLYAIKKNNTLNNQITQETLNLIKNAKQQIIILQAYYYPIKKFERILQQALQRGVQVKVITSKKRDQLVYNPLKYYFFFRKFLKYSNFKAYQFKNNYFHSKAYFIDKKYLLLGSFNNDKWSWKINDQLNLKINDEQTVKNGLQQIQNILKQCRKMKQSKTNWYRNVKFYLSQLFLYYAQKVSAKNINNPDQQSQ